MPASLDDEFALLEAWRAGDRSSGNQLFRRYFRDVFRFFRSKVGVAAEDLTQKTFLGLLEASDRFDSGRSLKAYIYGIANHQLLMYLRSTRRHAARFDPESWSMHDLALECPRLVARDEQCVVLADAMRQLPLHARVALELFYWDDLNIAEIATVQEVPEGTVKARLSRARQLLRELLEGSIVRADLRDSIVTDLDHWIRTLPQAIPGPTNRRGGGA